MNIIFNNNIKLWEDGRDGRTFSLGENKEGTIRFSRRNSAGFRVSARLSDRLKYHPISSHPPTIENTLVHYRFKTFILDNCK